MCEGVWVKVTLEMTNITIKWLLGKHRNRICKSVQSVRLTGFNCENLIPAQCLNFFNFGFRLWNLQNWTNSGFELSSLQNYTISYIFLAQIWFRLVAWMNFRFKFWNLQHKQHFQLCKFDSSPPPSSISHLSAPICCSTITSRRNSKSPRSRNQIYSLQVAIYNTEPCFRNFTENSRFPLLAIFWIFALWIIVHLSGCRFQKVPHWLPFGKIS